MGNPVVHREPHYTLRETNWPMAYVSNEEFAALKHALGPVPHEKGVLVEVEFDCARKNQPIKAVFESAYLGRAKARYWDWSLVSAEWIDIREEPPADIYDGWRPDED